MIKIKSKFDCTGCSACQSVCGKKSITMYPDSEGFLFPIVNLETCIDCGACDKVCPIINQSPSSKPLDILIGQNPNNSDLSNSSSGGIFSLIASNILSQNGKVYGAAIDYNDNYRVKHIRIDSITDLQLLRGSKYVQSNLEGIFSQVKNDLQNNDQVLFVGTPCQVAGLKKYLRKEYSNLLLVDLICHGVSSSLVWEQYIRETANNLGNDNSCKISKISFRDKRVGWNDFGFSIAYSANDEKGQQTNNDYFDARFDNPFMKGFLSNLFLRDTCTKCPAKNFTSGSDITLGDAWGIERYLQFPSLEKGMSVAIPLTDKGQTHLQNLRIDWSTINEDFLKEHNSALYHSVTHNKKRALFFKQLASGQTVATSVEKCFPPPTFLDRIIWSIKRRIK